jgi:TolB-like protein/DNA-binding SARP family transcriptional activator/Flp pilus assembly protein TadD
MGSTIRLRTLGALQLQSPAGAELRSVLSQPRRVALLVYLALATPRGLHRRDKLLALFWPEQDEQHARNALSQAVHFLRRTLGADAILSRGDEELGVNGEIVSCDAIAFEAALDAGKTAEALELYRGPLLEGFHVSDAAPEFGRWLDDARARLARRYAQAVEEVATAREAAGDFAGAVLWLRRLAAQDPFSSRVTIRLMRALASSGDPAAAIQHARVHETLLREELQAPPDPQVTALVRELQTPRRAEASPPLAVPEVGPVPTMTAQQLEREPVPGHANGKRLQRSGLAAGAVVVAVVGSLALSHGRGVGGTPAISCLAVLPFENLSRDSAREYFADAVTDGIITELARYERLSVISRSSIVRYKRARKPLPEIARELNCDGVVEGTVVSEGGRVRVDAQLVHAPNDRHLWAESYESDMSDMLALERRITQAIAGRVHGIALAGDTAAQRAPRRVDPISYGLYLRGRDVAQSRNPVALRLALDLFGQAIARDSGFALGYAGLADAYRLMAWNAYAPGTTYGDSARAMASRALALDSSLSEAHTSLGGILTTLGNWMTAETEFRKAIALEPGNAQAHGWYAILLVTLDRKDEAVREIRRAKDLDPLSQPTQSAKGMIEAYAGIRAPRKAVAERSELVDPTDPGVVASRSVRLAETGRCPEAYAENQRGQELAPGSNKMQLSLVGVHWLCGKPTEARRLLEELERRADAPGIGVYIAELYTVQGQVDSAFAWLERARWNMLTRMELRVGGRLKPLRTDPRYRQLLDRMGLP